MRKLVPALFFVALANASAGGAGSPSSWLGNRLDPAQTAFCRAHGCVLQSVRKNNDSREGWHDGTLRGYRLSDGSRLEVDVRPEGWISNARLFVVPESQANGTHAMNPARYPLAAEFLSALTGRRFTAEAVAACERAGVALGLPDNYGPAQPLSRWKTPGGLPFVARCGINSQVGVWAGWMQA